MKNSYECSRFFIEHKALLLKALTSNEKLRHCAAVFDKIRNDVTFLS